MNREELEKAHQQSLKYYDEYLNNKSVKQEEAEKLTQAKNKWEVAWSEMMEALLVLERIEI